MGFQSRRERSGAGLEISLKDVIREPGFYFFPGMDESKASEAEQEAWAAKIKQGPTGILIIHPEGGEAMSPRRLGTEMATNIVSALLAALLLTQVRSGFGGRVLFVTGLGLFGFVITSVPYWNWYGFPLDYTGARRSKRSSAGSSRGSCWRPLSGLRRARRLA